MLFKSFQGFWTGDLKFNRRNWQTCRQGKARHKIHDDISPAKHLGSFFFFQALVIVTESYKQYYSKTDGKSKEFCIAPEV